MGSRKLSTKTIEGTTRALESVDDIERGDSLAFGMLSVCDRITDDLYSYVKDETRTQASNIHYILQENFENTTGLLIDESRDTLYTTTTSKTTNGRL
jgi:uncharacterized protein YuzB (UPF0349 family)